MIANGSAVFILRGPVCEPPQADAGDTVLQRTTEEERASLAAIHEHLTLHGDGVKDVAFRITGNLEGVWKRAIENRASAVSEPRSIAAEGKGHIQIATVGTYGDTVHSLVNREHYPADSPFLSGYQDIKADENPIDSYRQLTSSRSTTAWGISRGEEWTALFSRKSQQTSPRVPSLTSQYPATKKCLDFHRYWTVDDKTMCSEYSAMRSIVVASPNKTIKMPMNEPATGKKKSQIEECVPPAIHV